GVVVGEDHEVEPVGPRRPRHLGGASAAVAPGGVDVPDAPELPGGGWGHPGQRAQHAEGGEVEQQQSERGDKPAQQPEEGRTAPATARGPEDDRRPHRTGSTTGAGGCCSAQARAYHRPAASSSAWVPDSTTRPASRTWIRSAEATVCKRWAM